VFTSTCPWVPDGSPLVCFAADSACWPNSPHQE
jgi:hypothetical protein